MPTIIRTAESGDYEGFLKVFSETEEYHRLNVPWKFRKPELELFSRDYYHEILNNQDAILMLAENKSEIVGYILGFRQDVVAGPILQKRNYAHIDDLVVKSDYRKQGIATLLMAEFEKSAKAKGANEIELNVWTFNQNAIEFYNKKGYEVFSQKMRKVLDSDAIIQIL